MSGEKGHEPFWTIFTPLHKVVKDTEVGKWFGFDVEHNHNGQIWFEALCFSLLVILFISIIVILSSAKYRRIPKGLSNFTEVCYEKLRGIVVSLMGESGVKFFPFLGTIFIFIFVSNLVGLLPASRSPTMTLSITLALGLSTFLFVQAAGIKANGVIGHLKHFCGPVWYLAFLMLPIELLSECVKPLSLSFRLFGNISGKEKVIEEFIKLGDVVPIQLPILFLGVLVSLLQAFIFTALSCIYLSTVTAHEEEHGKSHEKAH